MQRLTCHGPPTHPAGTGYTIDGKDMDPFYMPASLEELSRVQVKYQVLPGWNKSIAPAKKFEHLPVEAQTYVKWVESLTGVPVSYIGTGPGRHQMVTRGFYM